MTSVYRLRSGLLAAGLLTICAGSVFAQEAPGGTSGPPVYYAPPAGAGQRASWNPAIPLTQRAAANVASTGGMSSDYGMDFVTIGAPGNPGFVYKGIQTQNGSVNYAYRIGRTEVPTAVWTDFFNAASYVSATTGSLVGGGHIRTTSTWGSTNSGTYTGPGRRWEVANDTSVFGSTGGTPTRSGHMLPVGDITWRTAAIFCNWLHNDRALTREAFMTGAYDVSTFGNGGFGTYSDQLTHSTGARFWIPTRDEWIKAAHYDPQRVAAGQDGYWEYSITSDTAPIYEPPENGGEANSLFNRGGRWATVALGDYATVQSPWGLLDTAGGSSEWTEAAYFEANGLVASRIFEGSGRLDSPLLRDSLVGSPGEFPDFQDWILGLRLAAAIPSPSGSVIVLIGAFVVCRRSRRS